MRIRFATFAGRLAALALLAAWMLPAPLAAQVPRSIERVAGDLYAFRNLNHVAVFLVTHEGIIATDPINVDAANWLKAELARRFALPVRYLIYSHGHPDHISGGEVFADTAIVIAHENARRAIVADKIPTALPQITFRDRMTLELGGKTVELSYLGRNHSDSMIVMRFPAERAVFAVDFAPVHRLFYRDFPDAYLDEWPESLRRLAAMDFDILIPGHGAIGTKADVTADLDYLEELRRQVAAELAEGKSEAQIIEAVTLERYRDWERYDAWRALNVQGMVRHLRQSP